MKRLVMLLLVVAVSLSLCACGQTDPRIEKYEKYKQIIKHLEDENYDKVIDIVEGLAKRESADSETISGTVTTKPTEPALTPEQLTWQTKLVGTWIPSENAAKDGHTGFALNADGTCTVDGKAYTWKIGDARENSAMATVLDGQTKVYMLQFSVNSDYGYKNATLYTYVNENSTQGTSGSYYRNDDYTVVEVTNDNWQEYFEIKEVVGTQKNAFGEIDKFRSGTYFRLKDTYGNVNNYLSTGGVEYQYVSACQDVTVDLSTMTYTTSEVRNTSDHQGSNKLHYSTDTADGSYYGVSLGGFVASGLDKSDTDTVWRPENVQILRVQLTLYIVK